MKKWFAMVLVICLVIGAISGCGNKNDSGDEMEFEQLEWPTYDNAKQIPVPQSSMADVRNKNDVRFSFYLANTTFEDFTDYVAACKEKGFIVDPVQQDHRYYAFNDDRYELTVEYHEGDIMYVEVVEERFDVEIKLLHGDKTSAKQYDIRIEIDGYWEEDSEKGDEVIAFDAYLKEGQHTLTIENDDDEDVCGRIDFVVSKDGEYFEYTIECLSNEIYIGQPSDKKIQPIPTETSTVKEPTEEIEPPTTAEIPATETITLSEAKTIFESVFHDYDLLIEGFSDLLDYCRENTFSSIEEIHEYEEQWFSLSDTSFELADRLLTKMPPEDCKAEWDSFAAKLQEVGDILLKYSTLDTNLDNHYDAEEMELVINTACDEFVAASEEIIEIAKSFNSITAGIGSSTTNNSTSNPISSNSHKCEECGKPATKKVDLFGQTEYYCSTHYNEIMDIIDMMESDVGKGTASKHTCEECSSEGTHSIIGFSGKTEYYCTKHYNELQAMLEIFG